MSMTAGQVTTIEYLDDSHAKRRMRWTAPVISNAGLTSNLPLPDPGFHTTKDPQFFVYHVEDGREYGPYDFVTYLGRDGNFYETQLHASNNSDTNCDLWLENRHRGGDELDQYDKHGFGIVDWEGRHWEVTIPGTCGSGSIPEFTISVSQ
jgi:hypothetical protein